MTGREEGLPEGLVELTFNRDVLEQHGLPQIAYPVTKEVLFAAVGGDGNLPLPEMLFGLQEKSARLSADWKDLEPAMSRLSELIAPEDERAELTTAGEDWWLEIGDVDLDGSCIAIQRGEELVAAIARREDGRLRVACYRPLDGKSAGLLIGLSRNPHPDYGVAMRENNWEYALDATAGTAQFYAYERGEAYLNHWANGLGDRDDGQVLSEWAAKRVMQSRPASHCAIELGVHYAYGADG